jgi:large subunit ribosomal protein L10
MSKEKKQTQLVALQTQLKSASFVLIAHYSGLSVAEFTELRVSARKSSVSVMVIKNSLSKLAFKTSPFSVLEDHCEGPVVLILSDDLVEASKLIINFAKAHENLVIKTAATEDELYDKNKISALSKLESLDQIRAKLISFINTPATNLVRLLIEPPSKIARVLNSYSLKN